ncbi:MAG: hypothetical protein AAGI17_06340 [Planctomycetota bacterium]
MATGALAFAQPTITLIPVSESGVHSVAPGDSFQVTVAISGVDFDPFAPLTGLPAPAPTAYQINVNFSGGGRVVEGSGAADQVRLVDVDGLFGPQPAASFFTQSVLNDGLTFQASNAALVFGAIDPVAGLFDDGALFTFTFQIDPGFFGIIDIEVGLTATDGTFSADVLDYGVDGTTPGSTPGGLGNAVLGTARVPVPPSPGSAAGVAVGGLIASRRRR